jgi:hypothetical protein
MDTRLHVFKSVTILNEFSFVINTVYVNNKSGFSMKLLKILEGNDEFVVIYLIYLIRFRW